MIMYSSFSIENSGNFLEPAISKVPVVNGIGFLQFVENIWDSNTIEKKNMFFYYKRTHPCMAKLGPAVYKILFRHR